MVLENNSQSTAKLNRRTLHDASDNFAGVQDERGAPLLTSQELYEAFARNLRTLWEKKGFNSAHDLASKIPGLSSNSIRGWISLADKKRPRHAKSYPRLDLLERVAERLGVDIWELFHPNLDKLKKDLAELERLRRAFHGDEK
jgi:hypothetical protein